MIKFVTHSPTGKIMFSALYCRISSAFDRATVSLEFRSGQSYMDLDVLQCRSKDSDGPENAQKYVFRVAKIKKILWRISTAYDLS